MKINFQKRRYIKNRLLISLVLLITGSDKKKSYVFGRAAANYALTGFDERKSFSNDWSRTNLHSFWQMIVWSMICLSVDKPFVTFAGMLSLLIVPVSAVIRLF